jgi:hypothetical protein
VRFLRRAEKLDQSAASRGPKWGMEGDGAPRRECREDRPGRIGDFVFVDATQVSRLVLEKVYAGTPGTAITASALPSWNLQIKL